ncbi:uncharacterized protein LOC143459998 isoform X2 [Clavelina lepadiformis]|uniref:uncharacterized protein LOC143459998 isoform X2 n=1 Tax=Clavelina lepadiformis TaxID=159417 RepID=UPI004042E9A5
MTFWKFWVATLLLFNIKASSGLCVPNNKAGEVYEYAPGGTQVLSLDGVGMVGTEVDLALDSTLSSFLELSDVNVVVKPDVNITRNDGNSAAVLTGVVTCTIISLSSPRPVSINVQIKNINANDPEFSSASYSSTISEADLPGKEILTVSATDPDGLRPTYSISCDECSTTLFRIDSSTGLITLTETLSYPPSNYDLTVTATTNDNSPYGERERFTSTIVVVNVEDVDNHPPQFQPCSSQDGCFLSYSSDISTTYTGDLSIMPQNIAAEDLDPGINATITYAFTNTSSPQDYADHFFIERETGLVTVSKAVTSRTVYTLGISATESTGKSTFALLRVDVSEKDDYKPELNIPLSEGYIQENSLGSLAYVTEDENGTIPLKISASDLDNINASFVYKVTPEEFQITSDGFVIYSPGVSGVYSSGPASFEVTAINIDADTDSPNRASDTKTILLTVVPSPLTTTAVSTTYTTVDTTIAPSTADTTVTSTEVTQTTENTSGAISYTPSTSSASLTDTTVTNTESNTISTSAMMSSSTAITGETSYTATAPTVASATSVASDATTSGTSSSVVNTIHTDSTLSPISKESTHISATSGSTTAAFDTSSSNDFSATTSSLPVSDSTTNTADTATKLLVLAESSTAPSISDFSTLATDISSSSNNTTQRYITMLNELTESHFNSEATSETSDSTIYVTNSDSVSDIATTSILGESSTESSIIHSSPVVPSIFPATSDLSSRYNTVITDVTTSSVVDPTDGSSTTNAPETGISTTNPGFVVTEVPMVEAATLYAVAGTLGGLLFVCFIVIAYLVYKICKPSKDSDDKSILDETSSTSPSVTHTNFAYEYGETNDDHDNEPAPAEDPTYENDPAQATEVEVEDEALNVQEDDSGTEINDYEELEENDGETPAPIEEYEEAPPAPPIVVNNAEEAATSFIDEIPNGIPGIAVAAAAASAAVVAAAEFSSKAIDGDEEDDIHDYGYAFKQGQVKADKILKNGEFGETRLVTIEKYGLDRTDTQAVVKSLEIGSASTSDVNSCHAKIRLMKKACEQEHSNILQFYGTHEDAGQIHVATMYAPHGDLNSYLKSVKAAEDVEPHQLMLIIAGIGKGLQFLHAKDIVHCHLRSKCIMLDSEFNAMISDYENNEVTSVKPDDDRKRWQALEVLGGELSVAASDIWSFGVVMWEITSYGTTPYVDLSENELYNYLADSNRLKQPSGCSDSLFYLMESCWNKDTRFRPDMYVLNGNLSEKLLEDSNQLIKPHEHFEQPLFLGRASRRIIPLPLKTSNDSLEFSPERNLSAWI